MKNIYSYCKVLVFSTLLFPFAISAQSTSTFTQVHQLLQANCAGSGCHDGGNAALFNVNLNDSAFYASIINVAPNNPAAVGKYNKLVVPGDAARSFLLRKLAHGISDGLAIIPSEGADMPSGLPQLKNYEIELVRQWVLYGARDTGTTVDTGLINRYYRNGGIDDSYSPHTPPPAGQGFQIYMGRIFIKPLTEMEIFLKYNPHLTAAVEAPRIDFMTPSHSSNHHFVLYNFQIGGDALFRDGIRPFIENSQVHVTFGIGAKPGLASYDLPQNCAYFFDQGLMYDLNLHFKNTKDTVLSTDIYINIYTQPVGTASNYMLVRNFLNENIAVPWDSIEHTYTLPAYDSSETQNWKLWQIYSHTHRYGLDFDIYHRNADGSKGSQIYEGMYNYEQGFYQGFYGWGTDVTIETFPDDSLLEIDPDLGFVYEAKYRNYAGPNPCVWGETSQNEMMVMGFQFYYVDKTTGLTSVDKQNQFIKVSPNPSRNQFALAYELDKSEPVLIDLYNVMGEKVATLVSSEQTKGKHSQVFSMSDYNLTAGVYLASFKIGGITGAQKLILSNQ